MKELKKGNEASGSADPKQKKEDLKTRELGLARQVGNVKQVALN